MGFEVAIWRGISVFRVLSLLYAAALVVRWAELLAYPVWAGAVVAVMVVWTGIATYAYARPDWRRWPLLVADLAITYSCMLATGLVAGDDYLAAGAPPLTSAWVACPVLAWAVLGGRRWVFVLAFGYLAAEVVIRGGLQGGMGDMFRFGIGQAIISGVVLILLSGYAVGYMATIAAEVEERLARAVELEARTRERERLARSIHDSVLQVLAMVQRRSDELGGEAVELGRMAGEQESALRSLIGMANGPQAGTGQEVDLRERLEPCATPTVTVSVPATEVPMDPHVAEEVDAAVRAALANIKAHCPDGTRAWILVEDAGNEVLVTVRDDGPGMPEGRVAAAEADGRLGVAQSIKGRIRDLGGEVAITSSLGMGTEVELRTPRRPVSRG